MSRLKRCVALENIWYMSGIYGEDFITKSSVYFQGHATLATKGKDLKVEL